MPEIRYLSKAPIREAVIDIQVTPPVSLDALKEISGRLKDRPHSQNELWFAAIGFQINEDGQGSANAGRSPTGYRYTFENLPYVLQCQVNGFTFSHLPPYGNWEEMSKRAKELWEIYLETAKPENVSRIAVRYINSLQIPLPIMDFADYLNVPPLVPEGLPQSLASFLQSFVIVDNSTETVAVVTQVLEEQLPESKVATLIFDIDASKTYSGITPNTIKMWAILEELRNFKNRIFFKYLTEKTIRMFE
jgi:uncharacterized protein (TIGR04255 family)